MSEENVINFYRVSDDFGEFSNFAPFPIELDGERWPTSEHYFQAQKFIDEAHIKAICEANSPMIAARLGRSRKVPLRPDWESVKDSVMRKAVLAKFTQHADLKELLLRKWQLRRRDEPWRYFVIQSHFCSRDNTKTSTSTSVSSANTRTVIAFHLSSQRLATARLRSQLTTSGQRSQSA